MIVEVSAKAVRELKKLTPDVQDAIGQQLDILDAARSFSEITCEKLKGHRDRYKIRVGNFRLVLKKISNDHVQVTAIADRKDVYRRLFGISFL